MAKPTSINLGNFEPELLELAEREQRSLSSIIRLAVRDYIEQHKR